VRVADRSHHMEEDHGHTLSVQPRHRLRSGLHVIACCLDGTAAVLSWNGPAPGLPRPSACNRAWGNGNDPIVLEWVLLDLHRDSGKGLVIGDAALDSTPVEGMAKDAPSRSPEDRGEVHGEDTPKCGRDTPGGKQDDRLRRREKERPAGGLGRNTQGDILGDRKRRAAAG